MVPIINRSSGLNIKLSKKKRLKRERGEGRDKVRDDFSIFCTPYSFSFFFFLSFPQLLYTLSMLSFSRMTSIRLCLDHIFREGFVEEKEKEKRKIKSESLIS